MTAIRGPNARLSQRIAEEAQLLSEEKWMIDALKKLKELRNCLQIERLHLENERSQLRSHSDKKNKVSLIDVANQNSTSKLSQPSTSCDHSQQLMPKTESLDKKMALQGFNMTLPGIDDESCNTEELNLAVTNSVFTNQDTNNFDMEEEEEDMENCLIDMNMFMYGQ